MSEPQATMTEGPDCLVEVALPVPLDQTFTYLWSPPTTDEPLEPQVGDLVGVPFGRRREVIGLVVAVHSAPTATADDPSAMSTGGYRLRKVKRLFPAVYRLAAERLRLANWLARYYALPLGEVTPLFHPPSPGTKYRRSRRAEVPYPLTDSSDIRLTAAQHRTVAAAVKRLVEKQYEAILVHGVTGSGKTEIYLRVIAEALARGRGAIYLLPEIALTPQTVARITDRFGPLVGAVHSNLSAGQRCRVHEAAAAGEIKVVVGPRSAVFAPVRDLGVIVVDEEHESSYKQEDKPRYHARHVAVMRARENSAVVLLGSATPDLESYRNSTEGRYQFQSLPERAVGYLPQADVVDMRGQPAPEGFSDRLNLQIEQTLAADRQVILYYNRRGFARVIQCQACGESVSCPRCDIGLTLHLRPHRLLCHYCGFTLPVPQRCPDCAGEEFLPAGGGTEKVELSLSAAFPGVRLLRLDQDTTRQRGSHGRILAAFAQGEAEILVGTQMVAKGHHFPKVGLVGVLAADDGLTLPDFRAGERVFQLLTQVSGRTGRTEPGRVLFQTYRPDDPIIQAAAGHDYETFVAQELLARQTFGYPPFRRLLRLGVTGRRLGIVEQAALALASAIRNGLAESRCEILGPAPAVFPRLQDRYRFQILIKGDLPERTKSWLAECARAMREKERGLEVVIDVDPLGIY
ncbi:MAG: primosomal protein N' [bacterium]